MEQRSEEWFNARAGLITASKIADIMAKPETAAYKNYINQLIAERLTGVVEQGFTNAAMQHGIDTEDEAREYYESETFNKVELVGFVKCDDMEAGCSPDGLIDVDGLIEIKAPNTSTHIDFILGGKILKKYIYQMQWQMYCTNRQWCDFVSYDNRLPDCPIKIVRVERDEKMIEEILVKVNIALKEIDDKIKQIKGVKQ